MKKGELQVGRGSVKPLQGLPKSPPLLPTTPEQRDSRYSYRGFLFRSQRLLPFPVPACPIHRTPLRRGLSICYSQTL